MNYLLDSCTFLWMAEDSPRLSATARSVLTDPEHTLFLSPVSIFEILQKVLLGKLDFLKDNPATLLRQHQRRNQIERVPIDDAAMYRLIDLPPIHRDPFDRILICQAIEHSLTILTPDENIKRYPIKTEW